MTGSSLSCVSMAMISISSTSPAVRSIRRPYPQKGGLIDYDRHRRIRGSKISALVDGHGRPLACVIVPANVPDARLYHPTVTAFSIPHAIGYPITRPKEILADVAYDTAAIRNEKQRRDIKTMIPVNRRKRTKPWCGRPYRFDHQRYSRWTGVERFFSWLKACRKINLATNGRKYHIEDWSLSRVFSSSGGFWDRLNENNKQRRMENDSGRR